MDAFDTMLIGVLARARRPLLVKEIVTLVGVVIAECSIWRRLVRLEAARAVNRPYGQRKGWAVCG